MDAEALSEKLAKNILPVTYFVGILGIFGIAGNACVLYVYKYKYQTCNFRTFVICLATTDFVSCLFVFPCEIAGHRIWFSYPETAAWFCKLKSTIYPITVLTCSLTLLFISVDRFRKVCRPFRWQIKSNIALCLCFTAFGISLIMTIPSPILFGIQTQNITYAGNTIEISSCQKDNVYKNTVWMTVYIVSMYYTPIMVFMIATTILYGLILRRSFVKTSKYGSGMGKPPAIRNDTSSDLSSKLNTHAIAGSKDKTQLNNETSDKLTDSRFASVQIHGTGPQSADKIISATQADGIQDVVSINNITESGSSRVNSMCIADCETLSMNKRKTSLMMQTLSRKTVIMLIVTLIFNVTMLIYFCAFFLIILKLHIFEVATMNTTWLLFLSWRLYFINHVVNPIVYGFLDKRFRTGLRNTLITRYFKAK